MRKQVRDKSLFMEYVSHWYVVILTILFLVPGYAVLPFALSFFMAKGISMFWASICAICVSGFIATLPMFILNIKLAARKKFYALAVQFILFDLAGTAFFIINRILMSGEVL